MNITIIYLLALVDPQLCIKIDKGLLYIGKTMSAKLSVGIWILGMAHKRCNTIIKIPLTFLNDCVDLF